MQTPDNRKIEVSNETVPVFPSATPEVEQGVWEKMVEMSKNIKFFQQETGEKAKEVNELGPKLGLPAETVAEIQSTTGISPQLTEIAKRSAELDALIQSTIKNTSKNERGGEAPLIAETSNNKRGKQENAEFIKKRDELIAIGLSPEQAEESARAIMNKNNPDIAMKFNAKDMRGFLKKREEN